MSALFRRRRGRAAAAADGPYDAEPAEVAYRRLLELARALRTEAASLAAAASRVEQRAARLARAIEEYDAIAQAAIAGGRTIQAESAIESGDAAAAELETLGPQAAEVTVQRAALDSAAARIEAEAATVRARLDAATTAQAVSGAKAKLQETAAVLAGHRAALVQVVRAAEDETIRLEARARALAELYGETSGEAGPSP